MEAPLEIRSASVLRASCFVLLNGYEEMPSEGRNDVPPPFMESVAAAKRTQELRRRCGCGFFTSRVRVDTHSDSTTC